MVKEESLNELEKQIIDIIEDNFVAISNPNSALNNINNLMEFIYELNINIENLNIAMIIKNSLKLNNCLKIIVNNINSNIIKELNDEKIIFIRTYIELYNIKTIYNDILLGHTINPYDDNSQKQLVTEVKKGNKEAKNALILANEGLIKSIALKNAYKIDNTQLEIDDLIQEGRIGLLEAAERFDANIGCTFSTYAVYYINKNIYYLIYSQQRTIKLPFYYSNLINKYKKIENDYMLKYGYMPSYEELAMEMNISLQLVKKLAVLKLEIMSLDKNIASSLDDEECKFIDFIPDKSADFEDDTIYNLFLEELKEKILESDLSERNKEIIILRYGLYDGVPRTLKSLAKYYNLKSERIRVIIISGLKRIGYDKKLHDIKKRKKEVKKFKKV